MCGKFYFNEIIPSRFKRSLKNLYSINSNVVTLKKKKKTVQIS